MRWGLAWLWRLRWLRLLFLGWTCPGLLKTPFRTRPKRSLLQTTPHNKKALPDVQKIIKDADLIGRLKMSNQPTREEPEIARPTPDTKRQPVKPEIPPDKDTPEKDAPVKAS